LELYTPDVVWVPPSPTSRAGVILFHIIFFFSVAAFSPCGTSSHQAQIFALNHQPSSSVIFTKEQHTAPGMQGTITPAPPKSHARQSHQPQRLRSTKIIAFTRGGGGAPVLAPPPRRSGRRRRSRSRPRPRMRRATRGPQPPTTGTRPVPPPRAPSPRPGAHPRPGRPPPTSPTGIKVGHTGKPVCGIFTVPLRPCCCPPP